MIFDGADRVRERRRERRGKRWLGVGRGEKKCKNMGGRGKKENSARAAPRWEEGDKGLKRRGLPPVNTSYLKI